MASCLCGDYLDQLFGMEIFEQRISISFLERISWLEIGGQSRQLSLSQDIVGILFSRQGTV